MRKASTTGLVVAGSCAALLVAGPAFAAWLVSSTSATGASRATSLQPVTSGSATTTETTATVTWTRGSGPAPLGYVVTEGGRTVCSVAGESCTVSGLHAGTAYDFDVRPVLHAWSAPATTVRATTSQPVKAEPAFRVEVTSSGSPAVGSAATYRITATNGTTTDAAYTGAKTLSFGGLATSAGGTGATSTPPQYPASSVSFTAGVATVSATSSAAGAQALTVTEGSRTGSAAAVTWVTSGPFFPGWAGCGPIDRSKALSISVSRGTDAYGNPAPTTVAVSYELNNRTGNTTGNPVTLAVGATTSNAVTVNPSNDKGEDQLTATIVTPVPGYPTSWSCTYTKV